MGTLRRLAHELFHAVSDFWAASLGPYVLPLPYDSPFVPATAADTWTVSGTQTRTVSVFGLGIARHVRHPPPAR